MKRRLAYFASAFALTTAIAFGISFQSSANAAQSCQGQCKRNLTACENTARTQAEKSQCKKSYQGCISSCK